MRVLDLFSGIGGFSLGLERSGMETVAFCEVDARARKVLKKHWPEVPIYEDVQILTGDRLRADGIIPDVIVGGFPCQDISLAGYGAGLEGERSGLWWHFHRLIKEIKPKWVIIENVSALRHRGLDQVLRSLFEIGYDAEWHCIPASAIGAPHRRDRIWIVAYPIGEGLQGIERLWQTRTQEQPERYLAECGGWGSEPAVGRVAHGVPNRMDRLKQLGNSVVPQIPEMIGKKILEFEKLMVDMVD